MRLLRVFSAVVFLVLGLLPVRADAQLQITFTGGLDGYFRTDVPGPANMLSQGLTAVSKGGLLLGMGDNFGPEFGAAIQVDDAACVSSSPTNVARPRRLYKSDGRLVYEAKCDAVADFLMMSGYQAIVPGREDMIYGMGWLQNMARLLRKAGGPTMLAANLRFKPSDAFYAAHHLDKTKCPLLFADSSTWEEAAACSGDTSSVQEDRRGKAYSILKLEGENVLVVGVVGTNTPVSQQFSQLCLDQDGEVLNCSSKVPSRDRATLLIADPLDAVLAAIKDAVKQKENSLRRDDAVVVMAQMPRSEAQDLDKRVTAAISAINAKALADSKAPSQAETLPRVTVVLSEASSLEASDEATITVPKDRTAPVLTSAPAYNSDPATLLKAVMMKVTVTEGDEGSEEVRNEPNELRIFSPRGNSTENLLADALAKWSSRPGVPVETTVTGCSTNATTTNDVCKQNLEELLLQVLGRRNRGKDSDKRTGRFHDADITLLQQRDFFFGDLPEEYAGTPSYCETDAGCALRVALDRVLWKGDYLEYTQVSGKDLLAILKAANAANPSGGVITDDLKLWLASAGISQVMPTASTPSGTFFKGFDPAGDKKCVQTSATDGSVFCVNGVEIVADQSYWIASSDDLAGNKTLYSQLGASSPWQKSTTDEFLSEAFTNRSLQGEPLVATQEQAMQNRWHLTLDFAKLVAAYTGNRAVDSGDARAADFAGVADSRASQASMSGLDLETQLRVLRQKRSRGGNVIWGYGAEILAEFQRATQGSLANPSNPIIPTYAKNTLRGGFVGQMAIPNNPDGRFQTLGFARLLSSTLTTSTEGERAIRTVPFTLACGVCDVKGTPFDVPYPTYKAFKWRSGYRGLATDAKRSWWQADRGSYFEVGLQFTKQYQLVKTVTVDATKLMLSPTATTIPDGVKNGECSATDAKSSVTDCLGDIAKQLMALPGAGAFTPVLTDVQSSGAYWDIHLQYPVSTKKGADGTHLHSFFVESSNSEAYFAHGGTHAVGTQTLYAIPLKVGTLIGGLGNLSFAPSMNWFFYSTQVTRKDIAYRGFDVTMRYYFDRENRVPLRKQVLFTGPASSNTGAAASK